MKSFFLLVILISPFISCKKTETGGGLRIIFKPRHQFHYSSGEGFITASYYSDIINSGSTTNVTKPLLIQPVKDGMWHWRYIVRFDSAGTFGSKDFSGTVIIKTGQIEEMTIED